MIVSKQTSKNFILHFISVPKSGQDFFIDIKFPSPNKDLIFTNNRKLVTIKLPIKINSKSKLLGPLDLLNDELALIYVKRLPGQFFENYSQENIPTSKFNSPLASFKSAFFIDPDILTLDENIKIIVIAENV